MKRCSRGTRSTCAILWVLAGVLGGCTRDNPSFGGDSDGEADGSTSQGESGPDTADTANSASGTSSTSAGSDSGPATSSSSASTTDIPPAGCGDGEVNGDEECDPAAMDDVDCHSNCKINVCGDTKVAGNESCDDGNDVDTDECTNACHVPVCGDDILSDSEDCEPSMGLDGAPTCFELSEFEQGEVVCDDCQWADFDCFTCGDGVKHPEFEICEPSLFPSATCADIPNAVGPGFVNCNYECLFNVDGGGCCIQDQTPCIPGLPCCSGECVQGTCPIGG